MITYFNILCGAHLLTLKHQSFVNIQTRQSNCCTTSRRVSKMYLLLFVLSFWWFCSTKWNLINGCDLRKIPTCWHHMTNKDGLNRNIPSSTHVALQPIRSVLIKNSWVSYIWTEVKLASPSLAHFFFHTPWFSAIKVLLKITVHKKMCWSRNRENPK